MAIVWCRDPVGIGATTAAFSLADHVLIRPLPFRDADRLVKLWQRPPSGGRLQLSPGHFREWCDRAASLEQVAAFDPHFANLVGAGDPVRLDGARVSGELFALLGVSPLAAVDRRSNTIDLFRACSAETLQASTWTSSRLIELRWCLPSTSTTNLLPKASNRRDPVEVEFTI